MYYLHGARIIWTKKNWEGTRLGIHSRSNCGVCQLNLLFLSNSNIEGASVIAYGLSFKYCNTIGFVISFGSLFLLLLRHHRTTNMIFIDSTIDKNLWVIHKLHWQTRGRIGQMSTLLETVAKKCENISGCYGNII